MNLKKIDYQIFFNKIYLITPLLLSFLSACASKNNISEIVTLPLIPEEFTLIPDNNEEPNLNRLIEEDKLIDGIDIGRKDPFLPPQVQGTDLVLPDSFKFHGQLASEDVLNAFVTYKNQSGIIKPGDIGGQSTDLLPLDWVMEGIDFDRKILTLSSDNRYINIELFSNERQ